MRSLDRPSLASGLAAGSRFGRVVLAAWVAAAAALAPAWLAADLALAPMLERLPEPLDRMPRGELMLIVRSALDRHGDTLAALTAGGLLVLLLWGVLWRAGVGAWAVWRRGRPVRLASLLGLGLVGWWRMAGVVALGLAAAALALGALALGLASALLWAWEEGAEHLLIGSVLAVGLAAVVVIGALRAATLAAAWRVVQADRPGVARSWLGGLARVVRRPLATARVLAAWDGLAVLALAAAASVLVWSPGVADGPWGLAVVAAAALVRAFSRVALHLSFAPLAGLVEPGPGSGPEPRGPAPRSPGDAADPPEPGSGSASRSTG